MSTPSIIVVGSANTDLSVIADALPGPGETVLGSSLIQAGGGKGANQAVAAARAGAQVAFVGRVGDDDFGHATLDNLAREGINTEFVVIDKSVPSGVALIMVDANGENQIAVAPGANARVCPADVQAAGDLIASADLLLVQLEIPLDAVSAVLSIARAHDTATMLNPAPAPQEKPPRELLSGLDYLTPNRAEAERLVGAPAGTDPEALAHALQGQGVGAIVLTLGAEGACICQGGQYARLAPLKVDALDTVGAGDCFSGVLAVALGEGAPLREAAEFATCAAALSVQRAGAQPSLPRRSEIDKLYHERQEA